MSVEEDAGEVLPPARDVAGRARRGFWRLQMELIRWSLGRACIEVVRDPGEANHRHLKRRSGIGLKAAIVGLAGQGADVSNGREAEGRQGRCQRV